MKRWLTKWRGVLELVLTATLVNATTEKKGDPLDLVGWPTQRAYPACSSLYAKLAYVSSQLQSDAYAALPWVPSLQKVLGRLPCSKDRTDGDLSAYALLAKIQRGLDRLPLSFPQTYEAILGHVQALLGTPQDTAEASTAMGYINDVLAVLAPSSTEGQGERLQGFVGTLQEDLGRGNFLQSLSRTLFAVTFEPFLATTEGGEETHLENLLAGFALVARDEESEAVQALMRTFPEGDRAQTLVATLQQKVAESLADRLGGRSQRAGSCQTLLERLQRKKALKNDSSLAQDLSRMSSCLQDVACKLSDGHGGQRFDPYHFPRAVGYLWQQLHERVEAQRTRGKPKEGRHQSLELQADSLREAFAYLAQSFYLPAWRRQLGETPEPAQGTLLNRAQQLGREMIRRQKTDQAAYEVLLAAPFFGHVMLHELDEPETFIHRLSLLRSALEASPLGLDASVAARLDAFLGVEEVTSTLSLPSILALMDKALEALNTDLLKELAIRGRGLIDSFLFSLYKTVLPKSLSDVQVRLQAWFTQHSQEVLKEAKGEDLAIPRFDLLGKALAEPSAAFLPETVAQIYSWLGATDSVQPTSLLGVVNALEQGHFAWPLSLGTPEDQYPTEPRTNPTVYGLANGLRALMEVAASAAAEPCALFLDESDDAGSALAFTLWETSTQPETEPAATFALSRQGMTEDSEVPLTARVASLGHQCNVLTHVLLQGVGEWKTGEKRGSVLFSRRLAEGWGALAEAVHACLKSTLDNSAEPDLGTVQETLERLTSSLVELLPDFGGEPEAPEREPLSLPEEILGLSSEVSQWKDLFQAFLSYGEDGDKNGDEIGSEEYSSKDEASSAEGQSSFPAFFGPYLPLFAANVGDVEQELQRVARTVYHQELFENAERTPAEGAPLTASLQSLERSLTLLRLSVEALQMRCERAQNSAFFEALCTALRSRCSECFLGEGGTVFCRHKDNPRLFLRWSFDELEGELCYDDGVKTVSTDAQGVIQEGSLAGLKVEDFEPISLMTVLEHVAKVSSTVQKILLKAFSIF